MLSLRLYPNAPWIPNGIAGWLVHGIWMNVIIPAEKEPMIAKSKKEEVEIRFGITLMGLITDNEKNIIQVIDNLDSKTEL